MKTLFVNIKGLVQVGRESKKVISGKEMDELPIIDDAWLLVENDRIEDFGAMIEGVPNADTSVDCSGKYIFPGWVDSHTHIVFAGTREGEFVDRIKGLSYAEIAEKGGGILNSARKLAATDENELFESALQRVNHVIRHGTTTLEIKSGYGLTVEAELKMLRVIRRLRESCQIPIKATFLGAHAIPAEYKGDKEKYLDLVINEMLPRVADEGLAEYIDIFCEEGYFSVDDTRRLLDAGVKRGLKPKTHVNQFTILGGVKASVDYNAISVDHLEELGDSDVEALLNSTTIPVALPICSLYLSISYTPARRLIDAGLPLALATDYNPGSSPSGNMNLAVALASIKMRMTPEEAINAATLNGAAALELSDEVGSIDRGKRANFFVSREIPSPAFIPYTVGDDWIESVFVAGKKVK